MLFSNSRDTGYNLAQYNKIDIPNGNIGACVLYGVSLLIELGEVR